MTPNEVPARDWPLYYNRTYMLHRELGVVQVRCERGSRELLINNPAGKGMWEIANPADLHVWWPRPGAYNSQGCAIYIGRKAERSMKKSACPKSHYYVVYGDKRSDAMAIMSTGPNYMVPAAAVEALDKGLAKSVAVTRDIILTRVKIGEYEVILRGEPCGKIVGGEYLPDNDMSPICKRAAYKLMKEGVI